MASSGAGRDGNGSLMHNLSLSPKRPRARQTAEIILIRWKVLESLWSTARVEMTGTEITGPSHYRRWLGVDMLHTPWLVPTPWGRWGRWGRWDGWLRVGGWDHVTNPKQGGVCVGGGYNCYPLVSLCLLISLWALMYVMVIAALSCIDDDEVEVVECIYLSIWR